MKYEHIIKISCYLSIISHKIYRNIPKEHGFKSHITYSLC